MFDELIEFAEELEERLEKAERLERKLKKQQADNALQAWLDPKIEQNKNPQTDKKQDDKPASKVEKPTQKPLPLTENDKILFW